MPFRAKQETFQDSNRNHFSSRSPFGCDFVHDTLTQQLGNREFRGTFAQLGFDDFVPQLNELKHVNSEHSLIPPKVVYRIHSYASILMIKTPGKRIIQATAAGQTEAMM